MEDYEGLYVKYSKKPKAKCCIVCGEPETEVDFWDETGARTWQHTNRCKRCEEEYIVKFKLKYPNSKPKFLNKSYDECKQIELNRELRIMKEMEEFADGY